MPFRTNDDHHWVMGAAEAVFEDEVTIEESQGDPDSLYADGEAGDFVLSFERMPDGSWEFDIKRAE
jgi:hypothetical protein